MARLTKTDRETLRHVLRNMERGMAYVMSPETVVGRVSRMQSADVLTRPEFDGLRVSPVKKEYGSDLIGFRVAIDALAHYLATH